MEERAGSDFSSLENQRQYCAAYIASQGGAGWVLADEEYDDLGYSGGTLDRPALARLRADIAAGLVDMVVVYKIDRLSRSLRDFANLIDELDRRSVAFTSVTQAFDTSTSMGRLTLNVLLSFAQFEREMIGDRLRDWFAGAARKGLWPRAAPYGYRKDSRSSLVPFEEQASVVRLVFKRYCSVGSLTRVVDDLNARGIPTRLGRAWTPDVVRQIITNAIYAGHTPYKGTIVKNTHPPLVRQTLWDEAGRVYARQKSRYRKTVCNRAPLQGIVFTSEGARLYHHDARYAGGGGFYSTNTQKTALGRRISYKRPELDHEVAVAVCRMAGLAIDDLGAQEEADVIASHVARVDVDPTAIVVTLKTGGMVRLSSTKHMPEPRVPRKPPLDHRRPGRKMHSSKTTGPQADIWTDIAQRTAPWTAREIATATGHAVSTVQNYARALTRAGLLDVTVPSRSTQRGALPARYTRVRPFGPLPAMVRGYGGERVAFDQNRPLSAIIAE